jgi:hypothetical protein
VRIRRVCLDLLVAASRSNKALRIVGSIIVNGYVVVEQVVVSVAKEVVVSVAKRVSDRVG